MRYPPLTASRGVQGQEKAPWDVRTHSLLRCEDLCRAWRVAHPLIRSRSSRKNWPGRGDWTSTLRSKSRTIGRCRGISSWRESRSRLSHWRKRRISWEKISSNPKKSETDTERSLTNWKENLTPTGGKRMSKRALFWIVSLEAWLTLTLIV